MGIILNIFVVKSSIILIIHGIVKIITTPVRTTFGKNERVASLICVVAWKILITRPATNPARSSGIDTKNVIRNVSIVIAISFASTLITLLAKSVVCILVRHKHISSFYSLIIDSMIISYFKKLINSRKRLFA